MLILLLCLQAVEQIIIAILKLLELWWLITPEAYDCGRDQEQENKEIHKYRIFLVNSHM